MTRKEKLRLMMLRAWSFVTIPPDPTRVGEEARILLLRPDHLGDTLFTTPALRLVREALPKAHIAYMVGPWSEEAVRDNPNIDEVLTCDFPGFTRRRKGSPLVPYLYLRHQARKLRQREFDIAVNLRFDFWWGAMLACFAGIPHRLGCATDETKLFLSLALPYMKGRHEVLQNINLAQALIRLTNPSSPLLSESQDNRELEFHPRAEDEEFARRFGEGRLGLAPYAVVHPGAGSPVKLWRPEGYAQVADELMERHDLKIVLTGSKGEEKLVGEIKRQMRHEPVVLVEAGLGQLASVLKHAQLAVGVDSGVMHLASAVRTPTVRLYGPVDDVTFGPWGESERHVVVKSAMDCIPCNSLDFKPRELPAHPCVRSIEITQVLAAVERVVRCRE